MVHLIDKSTPQCHTIGGKTTFYGQEASHLTHTWPSPDLDLNLNFTIISGVYKKY